MSTEKYLPWAVKFQ